MAATSRSRPIRLLTRLFLVGTTALCVLYLLVRQRAGDGGVSVVRHDQLAVFVDHAEGTLIPVAQPGTQTYLPFVQEVVTLDRRPVEYVMAGNDRTDANHVPRLLVRGADGTTYAFEHVAIQYALDADDPARALVRLGPGAAFHQGYVDALARSVLRDAFGRLTPQETVLPDRKQAATAEAKAVLDAALAPLGVEVLEISVSKPSFSAKYEETIARRRVADADTEAMRNELAERVRLHPQQLVHVREDEALKAEKELAKLEEQLVQARWVAQRALADARGDAERTVQLAQLERDRSLAQAAAKAAAYRSEVEGFRALVDALAAQGELAVRSALIESIGSVPVTIQPFEEPADRAQRTGH